MAVAAQQERLASEMPDNFRPVRDGFQFERRSVMITMRDGVKLTPS